MPLAYEISLAFWWSYLATDTWHCTREVYRNEVRGDGNMVHSDTVHNLQGQDQKGKDLVEDLGVDGAIIQAMYV